MQRHSGSANYSIYPHRFYSPDTHQLYIIERSIGSNRILFTTLSCPFYIYSMLFSYPPHIYQYIVHIPFAPLSHPFRVLFMSLPPPFHTPFTPRSHPVHIPFTSLSHPVHIPFTSLSHPVHIPFTPRSHPVHIPFTPRSHSFRVPLTSLSHPFHLPFVFLQLEEPDIPWDFDSLLQSITQDLNAEKRLAFESGTEGAADLANIRQSTLQEGSSSRPQGGSRSNRALVA